MPLPGQELPPHEAVAVSTIARPQPAPSPKVNRLGEDRPRLVVIEGLELTTLLDPYLSLRALAKYSSCSVSWLRYRLHDPHHPLPCYRLPGGKVLVRRSEFDAWLARYRRRGSPQIDQLVDSVLQDLQQSG